MALQHVVKEVVISTLKDRNRGWNIQLFQNHQSLQSYICTQCKCICCDAVELGCNHNDNEIFLYCHACLMEIINDNNDKCPINGHNKPFITPNRAMRRHILDSKVYCPYSVAYHSNNSQYIVNNHDENGQIIDTPGDDQKEGVQQQYDIPTTTKTTTAKDSCHWNGKLTLNDLINKHITECMKQNDAFFALNLKNKNLERKIITLQNDLNEKDNTLKNEQETKNRLKAQVIALKMKLDSETISHQKYEFELKQKQNIINHQLSMIESQDSTQKNKILKQENETLKQEIKKLQREKKELQALVTDITEEMKTDNSSPNNWSFKIWHDRLKLINSNNIKYKSGFSGGAWQYSIYGPIFKSDDKITVKFEFITKDIKKNCYIFGFATPRFDHHSHHAAMVTADGCCYLYNDFNRINNKKTIEQSLKTLDLISNNTSNVMMSINMKARKGWIGDGNKYIDVNLPQKEFISMVIGFSGSNEICVKANVVK